MQAVDVYVSREVVEGVSCEVRTDACGEFAAGILVRQPQAVRPQVVEGGEEVELGDCLRRVEVSADGEAPVGILQVEEAPVVAFAVVHVEVDVAVAVSLVFHEGQVSRHVQCRVTAAGLLSLDLDVQRDAPQVRLGKEAPELESLGEELAVEGLLLSVQPQVQVGVQFACRAPDESLELQILEHAPCAALEGEIAQPREQRMDGLHAQVLRQEAEAGAGDVQFRQGAVEEPARRLERVAHAAMQAQADVVVVGTYLQVAEGDLLLIALYACLHPQRVVEGREGGHEALQVAQRDGRASDAAPDTHRLPRLPGAGVVGSLQRVEPQECARHLQGKARERQVTRIGDQLEGKVLQREPGVFPEAEMAYGGVDGVVAERLERDVRPEVFECEVPGVEPSGSLLCRRQVVGDASVADEQGVDAEAQVAPRRRFVGREGVDKELVVGDGGRVAPGKVEVHVVQLHVVDDDVSLQQGAQVELGRDAARLQEDVALAVFDADIVDDGAVDQPDVDVAHKDLRLQEFAQFF